MPQQAILPVVSRQPLSVILLAHNAADQVRTVLTAWSDYLERRPGQHQLLLVDDGSRDGTADIAAKNARVEVLRHAHPEGEGGSLRTGLAAAKNPLIAYTLCDSRYGPNHLNRLLVDTWPIDLGEGEKPRPLIDLVHLGVCCHAGMAAPPLAQLAGQINHIAQRIVFGGHTRSAAGWLGWDHLAARIRNYLLYGIRNVDPLCPYRLLRREVLDGLVLQSHGPFVHLELLAKANFRTLLISEDVPIGNAQRPLQPPPRSWHDWTRDARTVFWHPIFERPTLAH